MDEETEIVIGQIGLLLTQVRFARHALEGIERATTRYAGLALQVGGGPSGTPLGAPPLTDGALRVYVVNISDLTQGSSIGDILAGALGGAGRFLGGFVGSLGASVMSPVTSLATFALLADTVKTIDRIMVRIGNPSGAAATAPGTGGPTLSGQLDSITALVEQLKGMFGAATQPVRAGGGVNLADYFLPAYLIAEALTRTVNGLIILLPLAVGALASLLSHLGEIEVAILGLLEFALRNVLLLRASVLATLLDTVAVAGSLAAAVLAHVATAVDAILASVFRIILAGLDASLTALRIASTGIKNVIDAMMLFLRDGVGALLIFIGELRVFRLLVHVAQVIPLILPAIARIMDRPLSAGETGALTKASAMAPAGLGGAGPAVPIAPFPNVGTLALPPASAAVLRASVSAFGSTLRTEVGATSAAAGGAITGIAGTLRTTVGGLDANLAGELKARTDLARNDVAGLSTAMQNARAIATAELPDRGLAAIAKAYEGWLTGGGLNTIMQRLNEHFRSLPTDATGGGRTIPGRTITAVLADRTDDRVVVEIDEVVIDLGPPAIPGAATGPRTTQAAFDGDAFLEWRRDQRERLAPV